VAGEVDLGYVAIVAASLAAGVIVRRLTDEPHAKDGPDAVKLPRHQRLAVAFGAIVGGALAAKLPFVLADPEGAVTGLAWIRDGRTITWGLVGGYLGVELAKLLAGVKGKTGDGFAVPVAVSIGFGRIACFHAGCCYGQPTDLPWGVDFGDGIARHPNQLYETVFHLSAAAALVYIGKRGWLRTQRIKVYLMAYMAFRFVAELWRPEPRIVAGLTFYQLSAAGFLVLFAVLFAVDQRSASGRLAQSSS